MSPMAKMPGSDVSNFAVSTGMRFSLEIEAPVGDRPELHRQAEERQHARRRDLDLVAILVLDDGAGELAALALEAGDLAELEA